jgi:hypothetical protein
MLKYNIVIGIADICYSFERYLRKRIHQCLNMMVNLFHKIRLLDVSMYCLGRSTFLSCEELGLVYMYKTGLCRYKSDILKTKQKVLGGTYGTQLA